jgi:hypothetical protein
MNPIQAVFANASKKLIDDINCWCEETANSYQSSQQWLAYLPLLYLCTLY